MRRHWRGLTLVILCGFVFGMLLSERPAQAGGAILVGAGAAGFGQDAVPFTWNLAGGGLVSGGSIQYRTDGGALGVRDNNTANNSVEAMFNT
ncbi:MAG: hypothetical protein ACRD88_01130 [Terriglobia bacterium]